jgi:hypothetical protein
MKTEMVFETSVSAKAEPHYPAENPKELLHENISMPVLGSSPNILGRNEKHVHQTSVDI